MGAQAQSCRCALRPGQALRHGLLWWREGRAIAGAHTRGAATPPASILKELQEGRSRGIRQSRCTDAQPCSLRITPSLFLSGPGLRAQAAPARALGPPRAEAPPRSRPRSPNAHSAPCGSSPLGCAGHRATEEGPRRPSLPLLALPGRAGPQPRTVGSRPAFVSRARRRLPEPLCAARPRLSMDVTVSQLVELFLQSPLVTWVSARSGTGDWESPCRVIGPRLPTRGRAPVPSGRGGGEGG